MAELNEPERHRPVKSARRALALLDFVAREGHVSFQDVVELGIPRSSAHGLLGTLVESGWLEFSDASRQYRLGLHAWQIGQAYDGHRGLLQAAEPVMEQMVEQLGETVQLARLEGIENVYIGLRESPHPMRMASSVGMRLHSHATGIGKALLSTLPPEEARRRLSAVALPRLTDNTETDVERLAGIVDRVRTLGFAVDDEEFILGCRCVAIALTDEEETGVASAMSVTMPTQRTDATWPHALYPALRQARISIRRSMGLPLTTS